MKKIIAAALGTILMVGFASAQTKQGNQAKRQHGQHMKHHKGKMGHQLNLSEEQKKQAKAIGENYHKQVVELKKNDKLTMGEYKKQMAALQKDRKTRFEGILTQDQKSKIAEGKRKREEHAQVRGAARLERMKIHLGLKDEQVAQLKKQQDGFRSKARAIRENGSLTNEQKKDQMKALAKENKENFKSILTKEQQEKLESRKKDFKGKKEEAKK